MYNNYSIAMSNKLHNQLSSFLIREDKQEDLLFALWYPSEGISRYTSLLNEVIFPENGDRQVHGNVSFNPQYFQRVCKIARAKGCGVAFLHSHPAPGWQRMSIPDEIAESQMAGAAEGMTDLPLVGLTIGNDETWCGRFWIYSGKKSYTPYWVNNIRVSGCQLKVSHNPVLSIPEITEFMERTVNAWNIEMQQEMTRLKIGIVGVGSVGSHVAEALSRMGFTDIFLIDFDIVKKHNLDRLAGVYREDIGRLKVEAIAHQLKRSASCQKFNVSVFPNSIAEEKGYKAALDCDVIFSCVDRNEPRHILNHIAYAHLIPVIDGGIQVRKKGSEFKGVDWQIQTVGPDRPCLQCLKAYDPNLISLEKDGLLDDPSYFVGSSIEYEKKNENVFVFSSNVSSLEVLQLVELVTGIGGMGYFGVQRYRYFPGRIYTDRELVCDDNCVTKKIEATGDYHFKLYEAEEAVDENFSFVERLRNAVSTLSSKRNHKTKSISQMKEDYVETT